MEVSATTRQLNKAVNTDREKGREQTDEPECCNAHETVFCTCINLQKQEPAASQLNTAGSCLTYKPCNTSKFGDSDVVGRTHPIHGSKECRVYDQLCTKSR